MPLGKGMPDDVRDKVQVRGRVDFWDDNGVERRRFDLSRVASLSARRRRKVDLNQDHAPPRSGHPARIRYRRC